MAEKIPLRQGRLFVLSASSGCGKTTLVYALLAKTQGCALERVVTYTSRPPRPGEKEGVDYCFISPEQFQRYSKEGFFLERSNAYGSWYGTPRTILERLAGGMSLVLILDHAGTRAIMRIMPEAVSIWISPPSLEVLEQRLRSRGTEDEANLQKRLLLAQQELQVASQGQLYRYLVINDDFERSVDELNHIVMMEMGNLSKGGG